MSTKGPPQDDGKTTPVGSGQRNPVRPKAADDGRTKFVTETQGGWSDDGKTAFVKVEDETASGFQRGRVPSDKGTIRPGPSPRLPWPARDQQRGGESGSHGDEDSSINEASAEDQTSDEPATKLFTPGEAAPGAGGSSNRQPTAAQPETSSTTREDPVVGWLVIVQGPGKGNSVEIGIGANPIGRDRSQKICLDYGDQQIHREKHAVLVYDPRSRRFYLQSGDVRNLTYLGDELVLTPAELKGGETIVLGQTQLRFIPFCGPDFGWS